MAAEPFVPALAVRCIFKGMDRGRACDFSLWAVASPPIAPPYADLVALNGALVTALTGNAFLANLASRYVMTGVECHDASVERGESVYAVLALAGTAVGSLPTSTAAKVLIEPAGGSGFRRPSQTFIPSLPQAGLDSGADDNTLSAAYITAAHVFIGSINEAMGTVGSYLLGVVSKRLNAAPRATALCAQALNWSARPTVATQVRRLRRVSRSEATSP